MSLSGITASALSALQTNQSALNVVSNNVSNINTPGYAREVVNETSANSNGQLAGVDIASIQRVADQFLNQEVYSASGASSQYDTMGNLFTQLNGLLGQPGDNQSISTQLTNLASAFAVASQSPTSGASQTGVVNALSDLASSISNVSSTITQMQGQVDQQVVSSVSSTNSLIQQIYNLNTQISAITAAGGDPSGLQDQQQQSLTSLSQAIGIKTVTNADGTVTVSTTDGLNLVGKTYATLSYSGGATNGTYGNIMVQDINPQTNQLIGQPTALDPHLSSGSIEGLIQMRDQVLGGLNQSLGNLAQTTANAFNAQSNADAAFPPPTALTGRDTGLLSTDSLNFTGDTTIAVTDPNGNLVSRIDVNFDAGTLSVDGGPAQSIGTTIGSFTSALNSALGANGSASFANGQLSLSATGGNGIVVQDDASDPSLRGTTGFSQFFGLNDVFQSSVPSITATGLSASDSSGLAPGGTIALSLKGPNGDIVKNVSITTTAGQSIGDVVNALNTALGGAATFTLNANGSITTQTSAAYAGYQVNVTGDTTQRGSTGISFTELFGLGSSALADQAAGFGLTTAVQNNPAQVGMGTPNITASTVAGNSIITAGDNSGAIAMQNLINNSQSFAAAGSIAAQTASLTDYAASFYQNVSDQSNTITQSQTTQDDRLTEAQSRQSSDSGVNLDQELTNLTTYQQAYAAGARILSVVDQLYQTLLQIQ